MRNSKEHRAVISKIEELYADLFEHNGYGEIKINMKFLKKRQKEVVINCGKEYRFVLDYPHNKNEDCDCGICN